MSVLSRKSPPTAISIAKEFPHQIALKALDNSDQGERNRNIETFIREHRLSAAPRGMPIRIDGDWWRIYYFAKQDDALKFSQAFGGRHVDTSKQSSVLP